MWKTVKLIQVCKVASGNSIPAKKKEQFFTGVEGMPYIATKDVGFDDAINYKNGIRIPEEYQSNFKISPAGATLICAEGGSAGRKIAFSCEDSCYVNKLFSLKPSENIIPKFIYYYALSSEFQSQFKAALHGLIGGVSMSKIREFKISIPPFAEQKRIVEKLDRAFSAIKTASTKTAFKLSECEALTETVIQNTIKQRFYDDNPVLLDSLCDKNRGITYGVVKLGAEVPNGVPCLRTSNVKPRNIKIEGIKRISTDISCEYKRTILKGGEVLVNVRGTLGGVAVVPDEMAGWNISREVALVPLNQKLVNPDYVSYCISSVESQRWLGKNTHGAAYQGINLIDLRNLPINLPPKEQQEKIVNEIRKLESEIKQINSSLRKNLENLSALKSAILAQELQSEAV